MTSVFIVNTTVDLTVDDLKSKAAALWKSIREEGACPVLGIDGFGADRRDLWEIPEAIELCKRLVESGIIADLTPSTSCPGMMSLGGVPPELSQCGGLGAFEVFLISKGYYKGGEFRVNSDQTKEYAEAMEVALGVMESLVEGTNN